MFNTLSKLNGHFLDKMYSSFLRVMDLKEARLVLEVSKGDSVHKKYKELMRINHPDTGGSSYITSKINEAYKLLKNSN
ncbi:DnaJ-like protein [Vairimorpha necatrix]|uniref:Mitochondrial import inner membrane translocase subunit TIM14 n=1 Tax=Vairimorpha necatrix TaxID=6039 RepID=A0AAX4JGT9_9MICR